MLEYNPTSPAANRQVSLEKAEIDWRGACGNLAAAAGAQLSLLALPHVKLL